MTGPEHYREAERWLKRGSDGALYPAHVAVAQAHATLALVAATAYPAIREYVGSTNADEQRAWAQVTE